MALEKLSLTFASLAAAYRDGTCTAHDVVDEVLARLDRDRDRIKNVWLHLATPGDMHAAVERATARLAAGASLPLFGVPFAVKDNIDVGGVPTTIACPDLVYVPEASAPVVQRLVDAGAIFVGKVNLDQLATGLVGVRSPYGVPTNPFDASMIPGGSSSGSAVAVAVGQVAFALGTDTAGSGRVPAAFNNVVGLKPSRGVLSTRGVAPACRSLDCVTVFALTVADAAAVVNVAKSWDPFDPFSRIDAQAIPFSPAASAAPAPEPGAAPRRLGIPSAETLTFFGDDLARAAFEAAVARFRAMNTVVVEIDFRPFLEAGAMLYGGAFVTERLFAGGELLDRKPGALVPVVRDILLGAKAHGGTDVFAALYRLRALRQAVEPTWAVVDALLLPTTPTIYAVDDVLRDPLKLNANLGTYTTFGNLLDLAAIAVPNGLRGDGLPTGIMLVGPRASEPELLAAGAAYHAAVGGTLGATGHPLPAAAAASPARDPYASRTKVAVVGAHLAGQPLNHQLVGLGGFLVRACSSAPKYRLYALRGTVPPKPGLLRVREQGAAIALEVWSLDLKAYGAFVAGVGRPLCIGSVELEDGSVVQGFLCEHDALAEATDISSYGGWLAYLASKTAV